VSGHFLRLASGSSRSSTRFSIHWATVRFSARAASTTAAFVEGYVRKAIAAVLVSSAMPKIRNHCLTFLSRRHNLHTIAHAVKEAHL